jgi:hypothetical protein
MIQRARILRVGAGLHVLQSIHRRKRVFGLVWPGLQLAIPSA